MKSSHNCKIRDILSGYLRFTAIYSQLGLKRAIRTPLARVLRMNRQYMPTRPCTFVLQLLSEPVPTLIQDGLK